LDRAQATGRDHGLLILSPAEQSPAAITSVSSAALRGTTNVELPVRSVGRGPATLYKM